jgi:hypothetical protein
MNRWLAFLLGLLAQVLASVLGRYAQWRFSRCEEEDTTWSEDSLAFLDWLLRVSTDRFLGRSNARWSRDYSEHTELYA